MFSDSWWMLLLFFCRINFWSLIYLIISFWNFLVLICLWNVLMIGFLLLRSICFLVYFGLIWVLIVLGCFINCVFLFLRWRVWLFVFFSFNCLLSGWSFFLDLLFFLVFMVLIVLCLIILRCLILIFMFMMICWCGMKKLMVRWLLSLCGNLLWLV